MSTYANWAPNFKTRYGKFINPLPADNTFAKYSEFVGAEERPGKQFEFPVQVSIEHGQTHDVSDTAFVLESAIDSVLKNAVIDGATIMMVGNLPYTVIARGKNGAANGNSGGAFWKPIDLKTKGLMQGGELYRELALMYGPGTASAALGNIGAVAASVSGANLAAPQVVRLTTGTWAPGIWNTFINGKVDVYQSDGSTLRESDVSVTAVSQTNCRLTLSKSGSTNTVAVGDVLIPKTAKGKSCVGIQAILENSGTLFNISAADYPMWKALSFAVGGAMSRAQIMRFAARMFPSGVTGGGRLFVAAPAFADLSEEANALQRYTSNTDKVKRQGAENLEYTTAIGDFEVALHKYMKQALGFFISKNVLKRVGTTDLTFSLPGTNQWFYQELANQAGSQIRIFSNQAPIIEIPYYCGIFTGIASNADVASA